MQGRMMSAPRKSLPGQSSLASETMSVLLTFRYCTTWQTDLGEHRGIVTQGLVDVGDHLHDLGEQRALAVVDNFGDEVGADRLAVGVELDLAVGRVELDLGEGF